MDDCSFNAAAIQTNSNALLDEKSYSSSNKVNSYQSFTEKDTEFVLNETSSSHQSTFTKNIFVSFKIGLKYSSYDLYQDNL